MAAARVQWTTRASTNVMRLRRKVEPAETLFLKECAPKQNLLSKRNPLIKSFVSVMQLSPACRGTGAYLLGQRRIKLASLRGRDLAKIRISASQWSVLTVENNMSVDTPRIDPLT